MISPAGPSRKLRIALVVTIQFDKLSAGSLNVDTVDGTPGCKTTEPGPSMKVQVMPSMMYSGRLLTARGAVVASRKVKLPPLASKQTRVPAPR